MLRLGASGEVKTENRSKSEKKRMSLWGQGTRQTRLSQDLIKRFQPRKPDGAPQKGAERKGKGECLGIRHLCVPLWPKLTVRKKGIIFQTSTKRKENGSFNFLRERTTSAAKSTGKLPYESPRKKQLMIVSSKRGLGTMSDKKKGAPSN